MIFTKQYSVSKHKTTRAKICLFGISCGSLATCLFSFAYWDFSIQSMLCFAVLALWLGFLTASFAQQAETDTASIVDFEHERTCESKYGVYRDRPDVTKALNSGVFSIAKQYDLSNREREILGLLIRGRNTQRISAMLTISPHTVKSHVYNIYQKTGSHSSQDIIDIFEESCLVYRES